VAVVGDDDLASVDPGGRQIASGQRRRYHPAAEELAGGGDDVEERGIGLAALLDRLERRPEIGEVPVDRRQQRDGDAGPEAARFVDVPLSQGGKVFLAMTASPRGFSERQQSIRDPSQSGYDDDGSPPAVAFRGHD
jgi:hypothetical protein